LFEHACFKPRQLLNKFIHGDYSDLYVLVKEVSIQGQGKGKNFEDFIEKMHELDKVGMKMGKAFTRSTYASMLVSEQLAACMHAMTCQECDESIFIINLLKQFLACTEKTKNLFRWQLIHFVD